MKYFLISGYIFPRALFSSRLRKIAGMPFIFLLNFAGGSLLRRIRVAWLGENLKEGGFGDLKNPAGSLLTWEVPCPSLLNLSDGGSIFHF